MTEHQYGRGKFDAHQNYIRYMHEIVAHKNYQGIQNAKSADGRINWQVSSGKGTSFYKDYLARCGWWEKKADQLGIPGSGNSGDRFTIAARKIHPSGYRPCRLCGKNINVGYFYVNFFLARALAKEFPLLQIEQKLSIADLLPILLKWAENRGKEFLEKTFPERHEYFLKFGYTPRAFENSRHVRTSRLSPGYMGNPPDRLDGFHDYCLFCRKSSDPGRSDANMRTYNHDRRSFEWWAEGDWFVADALYNSAGPGVCLVHGCGKQVEKVSPDHVGPLACGFKQLALFTATCPSHNSAKNRRFTMHDVDRLIEYERQIGDSVASWQVRAHWDKYKGLISDDNQTKALSNSLRSLQDMYLRVLWRLYEVGQVRFLATLLNPQFALKDVEFVDLDRANLTYREIIEVNNYSRARKDLAARIVAIAFESLAEYARKKIDARKMVRADHEDNKAIIAKAIKEILSQKKYQVDQAWVRALDLNQGREERVKAISMQLVNDIAPEAPGDAAAQSTLGKLFDSIGQTAEIDFTRYAQVTLEM